MYNTSLHRTAIWPPGICFVKILNALVKVQKKPVFRNHPDCLLLYRSDYVYVNIESNWYCIIILNKNYKNVIDFLQMRIFNTSVVKYH